MYGMCRDNFVSAMPLWQEGDITGDGDGTYCLSFAYYCCWEKRKIITIFTYIFYIVLPRATNGPWCCHCFGQCWSREFAVRGGDAWRVMRAAPAMGEAAPPGLHHVLPQWNCASTPHPHHAHTSGAQSCSANSENGYIIKTEACEESNVFPSLPAGMSYLFSNFLRWRRAHHALMALKYFFKMK